MSLLRVGSIDGFDRERRGSNVSSHRRMSFSPLSETMPPKDRKASILPDVVLFEEVLKRKRIRTWSTPIDVAQNFC